MVIPFYIFAIGSLVLSLIDLRSHRLPNKYVLVLVSLVSVAIITVGDLAHLMQSLRFGFLYFAIFFAMALLSKGSMGFGDVKFSFACGQIVGIYSPENWLEISWMMFVLAALVSMALMALGKLSRRDRIAFGPFMAISTIVYVANSLG